jgi:putative hydrolase of the HAD superfamily
LAEKDLAHRNFPLILFDVMEPFMPLRVGYSVFKRRSDSKADYRRKLDSEARLRFNLDGLATIIEYGVWWDWDIEHLYELEAIWTYLDAKGKVISIEASWHGGYNEMRVGGSIPVHNGRFVVYSQPGKHAFAPEPGWFDRESTIKSCSRNAGSGGVHVTPLFEGRLPKDDSLDGIVRGYLKRKAFVPSFRFTREWSMPREAFMPWEELQSWIPLRVREVLRQLGAGGSL